MHRKVLHNESIAVVRCAEGARVASAVAAEVSASAVLANTSTRTLILGIDKAGRIRYRQVGPISEDDLEGKLLPLLKQLGAAT